MLSVVGFDIQEKLYESLSTVVYRAIDLLRSEPVMLKTLRQDTPHPEAIASYRWEYEIGCRLTECKCVAATHALIACHDKPVLVMEDIGGLSLRQWLAEQRPSLEESLHIAGLIAEGIAEIHAARIIHKHINPDNIVFNPVTGRLKIIDFGIATLLPGENPAVKSLDQLKGTLPYMSPEQTQRMNRVLDYRTDFYSLGVTLYELFSGVLPFNGNDTLEWVHCHLADMPAPLHEMNAAFPQAVSDIVQKLLAKTPEARYQSAWGIKTDIDNCLLQLRERHRIEPFPLASHDVPSCFQLTQTLYGREDDIRKLLDAFEHVSHGERMLMLIAGYSGIGKTSLVQELFKPITMRRGYFISGKFDQFQRNVPYRALANALQSLIGQLLTESEARLQEWRELLMEALERNAQVIADVIPEIELIIGRQPPVEALSPQESQNRFNLLFQRFIRVFYRPEHPLVIFLDDLQWADTATLQLLEVLLADEEARHLLIIGAFRNNLAQDRHPLTMMLERLERQAAPVSLITLQPMTLPHVTELVRDTLFCEEVEAEPLARLVLNKTAGNPFFAGQFLTTLHQKGLIRFHADSANPSQARWQWDMQRIEQADITDNVVELMQDKLRKLQPETVTALKMAACLGNCFDLTILAMVWKKPVDSAYQHLFPAIREGILLPASDLEILEHANPESSLAYQRLKFLHDRVQQAAYALIPDEEKPALHLRIGRLMIERFRVGPAEPPGVHSERLFEVVDHLNRGHALIDTESERIALAQLNLDAARKAKFSSAYMAALNYLQLGMTAFGGNWSRQYALTLALYRERAEVEYLNGNYEASEQLIDVIWRNAELIDRSEAYAQLVTQLTMLGRNEAAIAVAGEALSLLGMNFPPAHEVDDALGTELADIEAGLQGRSIASLINLPQMTDPKMMAVMKVMLTVHTTIYFTNRYALYSWVLARMTKLSMQYGNVPESSKGYASFGNTLAANLGHYQSGYEFGMLGLRLAEKYGSHSLKCKACLILSMFLNHWVRPVTEANVFNNEGEHAGMESGEFQFIGYILAYGRTLNGFLRGHYLPSLLSDTQRHLLFTSRVKHNLSTDNILGCRMVTANLCGETAGDLSFDIPEISETSYLAICHENRSFAAVCFFLMSKAFALYLYGAHEMALDALKEAVSLQGYVKGNLAEATLNFYHSLILIALYRDGHGETLQQVANNQSQMQVWAEHCPANFLHQYQLVAAELARVQGNPDRASKLYDAAIQTASESGHIHHEALANELAAKFWLRQGKTDSGHMYLRKARLGYTAWGAKNKMASLLTTYPQLQAKGEGDEPLISIHETEDVMFMPPHVSDRVGTGLGVHAVEVQDIATLAEPAHSARSMRSMRADNERSAVPQTEEGSEMNRHTAFAELDIASVLKASQAISSEIVLDKLLDRLLRTVMENAGAQLGRLLLHRDGRWVIVASLSTARAQPASTRTNDIVPMALDIPTQITNYVERTHTCVVLQNAAVDGLFTGDPYVLAMAPKSVLCMPVIRQSELMGMLYLENDELAGVFHAERVEVLKLLATQAAISLQNALLYESLERDITERKRLESVLQHQATHDTLTGLPNRHMLMERLEQAIAQAKRNMGRCAVCSIDLDRFKLVNDSFGHELGDELLKTVAARITSCVRGSDIVARVSGDEFVLLLQDVADNMEESRLIKRVLARVMEPALLSGGRELAVTCSVGYSAYPADGSTAEDLLRSADVAMYLAKQEGRNNLQTYRAELGSRLSERVLIETELRHAIEREQLSLHYQPQVELKTGLIVGVEALLRWQHPEFGNISPGRFIPVAEETGLIEPLGEWVIQQACKQNRAWQDAGLPPVTVAVNVSANQLRRDGLEITVSQVLASSGLDARYLELELTESASMHDPEKNIALMHKLKELGVQLAIDDFGTGYSNMHYLKRFPIDKLKLDGSFVKEITTDPRSLAITDAIILMGHRLDLNVIAEMVETSGQIALLRERNCDQIQGYYFSRPLPVEDCTHLLRKGRIQATDDGHSG